MAGKSRTGRVVVISGPSGAGKTSVMRRVYQTCRVPLVRSVSATSRPPRPDETDGIDYHFVTNDEFQLLRQRGKLVECFEVFGRSYWYGTLRSEVASGLNAGKWVVLEIDVQGAMAVMQQYPDTLSIFLSPSSPEDLEQRLRARGTETEEAIQCRLAEAERELAQAERYQYHVVNDDMDQAVREIDNILTSEWETNQND